MSSKLKQTNNKAGTHVMKEAKINKVLDGGNMQARAGKW
jgi:hypothetical protein